MENKKKFFIRVSGRLVVVTKEIYRDYYKMDRHERYLEERDAANGKVLYSDMDTDEMLGEEAIPDAEAKSVEQSAIDGILVERLRQCLNLLSDDERRLVDALFYEGYSEREWSEVTGVPRKTIAYRRSKVLSKIKNFLES